jgi:hypothetical protein
MRAASTFGRDTIGIPRSEWGNQAQWALTAPLLAAGIAGVTWAPQVALALCVGSTVYYLVRLRSLSAYRVQVRLGFLGVVGLALAPGFGPLLWLPTLGTSAQVLFGYCPMARVLDLMPWNRSQPLSLALILASFSRRPGADGLLSVG